ncbi:MAG: SpoIIE family protein phosphatase [Candidatus Baltobacteraceae bacterium]
MQVRNNIDPLDLLAEASRLLTASFDLSSTLPKVADLCVRNLADYCAIFSSYGEAGGVTMVEAADQPGVHMHAATPEALPAVLREHGYESIVACPITGRSVSGIFAIANRSPDVFGEDVIKLANILALQIANSLQQSVLFERTYRVADRLQRALLPEHLPTVPGARFHAAYRPASDEAEVGGDWYDAFWLPDGRVAISMGDVAGHGLSAATIMGEIRQAMRTTAVFEHSPATVLEHINNVINLRSGIGMVTAIFAYYEPAKRELTYAVAGHPAPALAIGGGFCGFLPGGGMPLGVDDKVQARDWTMTLPPRSGIVFYTDGMTEYSRDIFAGEAMLLQASARAFAVDGANPALALQERIFDAKVNRDDAATLTLACEDGPIVETARFSAIPVAAPIVRALLQRFCEQHGVGEVQTFSIITAAGEAVANAVEHAYRGDDQGFFYVRPSVEGNLITIEIEDGGRWRPFAPRDERGRGMVLMYELMDRVRITSTQSGTNIIMTTSRTSEEPAPH